MSDFLSQGLALAFIEFLNALEAPGVLRDQSTLFEQGEDVVEIEFIGIGLDISHEVGLGNAHKRVLDSVRVSTRPRMGGKANRLLSSDILSQLMDALMAQFLVHIHRFQPSWRWLTIRRSFCKCLGF